MDLNLLQQTLQSKCKLTRTAPILIGVSGGPDSLCLVHILHELEYPVIAAVFDHQLRSESSREVEFVMRFAEKRGIGFQTEKCDVRNYAEANKLSIEEAARVCRYRFLFSRARQSGAQAVLTGHHADDLVETVLQHFLRGAGMKGLRGLLYSQISEWDEDIPLARPLLGVWKAEINAYCQEHAINPVIDKTNFETIYQRNRIRNALIPELQTYNPEVKQAILRMAENMLADDEVLESVVDSAWDDICQAGRSDLLRIDLSGLLTQPLGIQRRLIRRGISKLRPGLRNIDFAHVEKTLTFAKNPTRSKSMDLTAGLRLLYQGDLLMIAEQDADLIADDLPQIKAGQILIFNPPVELRIGDNWLLKTEQASFEKTDNPFQTFLDWDKLEKELYIRTRLPGDRFQPLGMLGRTQKLKDFFINEKLLLDARDHWPIVLSGERITWIPGFRPAHFCRVTDSTLRILRLSLVRE